MTTNNQLLTFQPGKFYKTRDGRKAQVLADDMGNPRYPLFVRFFTDGKWSDFASMTSGGRYYDSDDIANADLIAEWKEPRDAANGGNQMTPNKIENPRRRFHIEISLGGDTLDDALVLLRDFVDNIESGGRGCVTGGPSFGGHFQISENPNMTHKHYFEAVAARQKGSQP